MTPHPTNPEEEKGTGLFLVYNKREWLNNEYIKWTEEEIDNADEKGFIGEKHGVACYLSRFIPAEILRGRTTN